MGDLTKNFSEREFIVSAKFPELAAKIIASPSEKYKIFLLSVIILQPARNWIKRPIKITSGICDEELNTLLGRDWETTDHFYCNYEATSNAVDFIVLENGIHSFNKTELVYLWIKDNLEYGQLIWYPKRGSVHVTLPTPHHYKDYLVIEG